MPQEDKEKMPEKYEAVSFDEFESIGIVNAKDKAARFYAVMHFYYSLYDGAEDKENVKDEFVSAIKSLVQELK